MELKLIEININNSQTHEGQSYITNFCAPKYLNSESSHLILIKKTHILP